MLFSVCVSIDGGVWLVHQVPYNNNNKEKSNKKRKKGGSSRQDHNALHNALQLFSFTSALAVTRHRVYWSSVFI